MRQKKLGILFGTYTQKAYITNEMKETNTHNKTESTMITQVNVSKQDKMIKFNWNNDVTECDFITMGDVSDEEINHLIENDAHKGADVEGWEVEIK